MSHRFDLIYLKIVLFSLVLTPSLRLVAGLPSIRADDVLLLLWPLIALANNSRLEGIKSTRFWILASFFGIFTISLSNGIINGYGAAIRDFNQFVRFGKYVAMFLLAFTVLKNAGREDLRSLIKFIISCGFVLFAIVLFQYFDVFGLNKYYVEAIAPTQFDVLLWRQDFPRPVGMIGNPNELGYLFVLLFFSSLIYWKISKSKFSFLGIFLFFFGVLFTISRSAMAALFAGFFAYGIFLLFQGKASESVKNIAFVLVVIVVMFAVSLHPLVYDKFTWRLALVFDIENDSSFQMRLLNWQENIQMIKQHPFLGVGPLRRVDFAYAADNEWLLVWRSYGIVGVLALIGAFGASVFKRKHIQIRAFEVGLLTSAFLYMIPAAIFHSLALFPFYLFFLAFIDTHSSSRADRT